MADHDDELDERFRSLEGVPVPGWRDRVQAKDTDELQLEPDGDGPRRWPPRSSLVLVGAAAAVIALLIGVVAWPSDDDEPVATGASTFGDLPPTDAPLMCPPALLDVGDLFDGVTPPPEVVAQPATPGGASPYALQWTQDGRDVVLSYPGPSIRTADLPPSEDVVVPEGRVAHLEYRANLTADVRPPGNGPFEACEGFWISVAGDGEFIEPPAGVGFEVAKGASATSVGTDPVVPAATEPIRDLVLDIAATVQIRAPEGTAKVPDVVGLGAIEAQDLLSRAGLVPSGDAPICCDFDDRPIAEQSPAAGETVPIGEPVTLRLEAEVTTTTAPPDPVEVVDLPVPAEPIVCPFRRVEISGGVYSEPQVAFGNTIEWVGSEQTNVHLSWPNQMYLEEDSHATRELEVNGRPALMHDNGDGQALVYDTGLPDGPCRWIEIAVFGGDSIERREELAVELATDFVTIGEPRFTDAPDASGLSLSAAVDLLARAGFIADWGYSRPIGDEPTPPGNQTVQRQLPPDEDGVVRLEL